MSVVETGNCQSCGMKIDNGIYCQYCVDEKGNLQEFDERFERMVQWVLRKDPSTPREKAEQQTRDYMRTMPAWKDHAKLN